MEAKILNLKGAEVGSLKLPENVFGVKPQPTLLHEVTTIHQCNQRQGDANTKTRAEVSGGGKKPWKQKGTGRARHGSTRSPIWRHGGVAWGPRTHSYRLGIPRQKARLGLAQALSASLADGRLVVVDAIALDGAKTKQVAELLKAVKAGKSSLIVVDQHDASLVRAARNVAGVKVSLASHLNAYDVLACRTLIMTKGAIEKLAPRWN
ncbi:MAG: 50S ribosomal protein L4 [Elusimicrobia bacterium]|nr:50S ribosomal protein L4 [Elusimicrobiota bacterium]